MLKQTPIITCPMTQGAVSPVIVAAGRNMQATAHQANGKGIAAAFDHAISHFDAFAKNAAASLKKSRSFLT